MSSQVRRKLTTILAADADGYSREMEADEVRALAQLQAARGVFAKFIERHHGRIANTAGDGLIAEFPSVVEAVQCAIEVQRELGASAESGLRYRIGVHLGDVMVDGNDLLGEGVNLAARLQSMAEPGGILISRQVYDQVHKKLSVGFEYLGEKRPKNYAESIAVYGVAGGDAAAPGKKGREKERPRQAADRPAPASDQHARIMRRGRLYAGIALVLLAIDVATGMPFWSQWPALGLGTIWGLQAAPLFARGWFKLAYARITVLIAAMVLINLLTWSGFFWAIWPALGLVLLALIGRLLAGPG